MENVIKFDLASKQIKFRDILNQEYLELEVYAISDADPNRNNSHFTYESMQKAVENGSFKNKPIVGFFKMDEFTSHEGEAQYDQETDLTYWDTTRGERILGWIRESDPVELVEKDGLHWIKFRCVLCIKYCYNQVKRLLKDRKKKVSVEITVNNYDIRDDGVIDIKDFTLDGTTILGKRLGKVVEEGIEGAHATVIALMQDDNYENQRQALSFAYQKMDSDNAVENIQSEETLSLENTSRKEEFEDMEENTKTNTDLTEVVEVSAEFACGDTDPEVKADCNDPELEMGCGESEAQNEQCDCGCGSDDDHDDDHDDPEDDQDDKDDEQPIENGVQENEACGEQAESCDGKTAELEAKCAEYCGIIAKMEADMSEQVAKYEAIVAKYADYDDIKARMEAAEAKVYEYFCNDLKASAIAMMADEKINQADYDAIIDKCSNGEYSCEDDIKKEVAYAVYNARPTGERRFSVEINNPVSKSDVGTKPMTREERLKSLRK